MCIFSRAAEVSKTNIFARASKDGRQYLVYAMTVNAPTELAMILPLPVPKDTAEDAVKFINLEKYPEFFAELASGFPQNDAKPGSRGRGKENEPESLQLVDVGDFVASFVPSLADFKRLDDAFKLDATVWDKLPQYKSYGFAVFQLKKGKQAVHPMAFEFPRAKVQELFFPTVHIHDGTVGAKADFDHMLYCQASNGEDILKWEESTQPAELFLKKLKEAQGIIAGGDHVYRLPMRGKLTNEDVIVK
jgi:hypothetical protein